MDAFTVNFNKTVDDVSNVASISRPDVIIVDIDNLDQAILSSLQGEKANFFRRTKRLVGLCLSDCFEYRNFALSLNLTDIFLSDQISIFDQVLRAFARRNRPGSFERIVHLGALTIDEGARALLVDGKMITVPYQEYNLLATMSEEIGKVWKRDELRRLIGGCLQTTQDRSLDKAIARARQALGPHSNLIQTVEGLGYRMSDDV